MPVIHTREGHRPDMTDAPPGQGRARRARMRIGDPGPMGRILIRGEAGHDIIPELAPERGRAGDRQARQGRLLRRPTSDRCCATAASRPCSSCGVTTEVCVHTTVREANDRGYRCIVVGDCCGSYFPEFHEVGLRMITAQGGIFGWVLRLDPHPGRAGAHRRPAHRPSADAHSRPSSMPCWMTKSATAPTPSPLRMQVKTKGRSPRMLAGVAVHHLQRRADVRRQVGLVDDEQVGPGDAGAALARDLVAAGDVDDVDGQVGQLGAEGGGQVVAAALDEDEVERREACATGRRRRRG